MAYCQSIILDDFFLSDKTFGLHNCVPRQGSCSDKRSVCPLSSCHYTLERDRLGEAAQRHLNSGYINTFSTQKQQQLRKSSVPQPGHVSDNDSFPAQQETWIQRLIIH